MVIIMTNGCFNFCANKRRRDWVIVYQNVQSPAVLLLLSPHTCAKFNCYGAVRGSALFALIVDTVKTDTRPRNAKHKKGGALKGWTAPFLACVIFALGLASSIQKTWWNLTDDFLYLNTFEINRRSAQCLFCTKGDDWFIWMVAGWVSRFLRGKARIAYVWPTKQIPSSLVL